MKYIDSFVLPVPKENVEAYRPKTMPFDAKRMFWGGFKVMIDL